MKSVKTILNLSIFLFSSIAYSADTVTSKVVFVGINTNSQLFIQLESDVVEVGCTSTQLILPSDSPIKEHVLSLALTAQASGKNLTILPSGCVGTSPSIRSDGAYGFIYIQ